MYMDENSRLIAGTESMPLYLRVLETFRDRLFRGIWKPGDMLPTENELSEELGVSSGTIRRAILSLVQEGQISRRPGKGSFVTRISSQASLARFFRFRESDTGESSPTEIRVAGISVLPEAPKMVAEKLGVRRTTKVLKVQRLLLMAGKSVCTYTSYMPYNLVAGLENTDLTSNRLYLLIEEATGNHVVRAEEMLRANIATPEDAALLGIDAGMPVILIERTAYTHNDKIIEWRQTVGRSDEFSYKIRLP